MNKRDTIMVMVKLEAQEEEKNRIKGILNEIRMKHAQQQKKEEIIPKEELENNRMMAIELFKEDHWGPLQFGLLEPKVNKKKRTLEGLRIYKIRDDIEIQKCTFFLRDYEKKWRAWTI